MTDHQILLVEAACIIFAFLYVAGVYALRQFCRWAIAREAARTFVDDFVPETGDVARSERILGVA